MKKFLILFLLSVVIGMHAMEQLDCASIKLEKQEEDEIITHNLLQPDSEKNDMQEQRDKNNQNLISALDKVWDYLYGLPVDERDMFFEVIDQVLDDKRFLNFSFPAINEVCNLIKAQDDKRKRCWREMIKVSRMSKLIIECYGIVTKPRPFSVDLQEYLQDQISGNYDPDEQIDDWLQEVLRLYKK